MPHSESATNPAADREAAAAENGNGVAADRDAAAVDHNGSAAGRNGAATSRNGAGASHESTALGRGGVVAETPAIGARVIVTSIPAQACAGAKDFAQRLCRHPVAVAQTLRRTVGGMGRGLVPGRRLLPGSGLLPRRSLVSCHELDAGSSIVACRSLLWWEPRGPESVVRVVDPAAIGLLDALHRRLGLAHLTRHRLLTPADPAKVEDALRGLVVDSDSGAPIAPTLLPVVMTPGREVMVLVSDVLVFDRGAETVHVVTRQLEVEEYVAAHKRHSVYLKLLAPRS